MDTNELNYKKKAIFDALQRKDYNYQEKYMTPEQVEKKLARWKEVARKYKSRFKGPVPKQILRRIKELENVLKWVK